MMMQAGSHQSFWQRGRKIDKLYISGEKPDSSRSTLLEALGSRLTFLERRHFDEAEGQNLLEEARKKNKSPKEEVK